MRVEVVVPQIGEAVAELSIVRWLKAAGDSVTKGEVLFEIDSDKAIVEVECFVDGKLIEIIHGDGSTVMPQNIVAILETEVEIASLAQDGNSSNSHDVDASTPGNSDVGHVLGKASPLADRVARELGIDLQAISGTGPTGRIMRADVVEYQAKSNRDTAVADPKLTFLNVSPKARLLARELGVDLAVLVGHGIGGMVVSKDVLSALPATDMDRSRPQTLHSPSKLRQIIAERTLEAKQTVPHFYLSVDVNMTQVNALRQHCVDHLQWERPPTYTDILVRVCSLTLAKLEWANRSYTSAGIRVRERVNIGIAVGTDEGLIVPVIPEANEMTLTQTVKLLRALIERARHGRLKASDFSEKSMVISNLGMYSVDRFIAIIDIPDPMILAVGRVVDRVVPIEGQVRIQPMCTLTLSVDHRLLDGVQGAVFLERIKDYLESPFEIMG